ncbi:MAG TPA: LON peptidase substrate-binding domain-containing protein [Burkholderiales bacterium]|nr:LON peptidase substrate-binding domain-containing protein [Burkholderiales bacterium]
MSACAARDIALFPLHAVLFPGGVLALRVFEPRYMEMSKACLRDDTAFGVCLIREGAEVGAPALPAQVGCLARITQWDMPQLGVLQLTTRGERRFRIRERRVQGDGLARAVVELLPDDGDAEPPQRFARCARLLKRVIEENEVHHIEPPFRFDSSAWVSARLAEILPLPLQAKQKLLELDSGLERLEILHALLARNGLAGSP